MLLLLLLLLMMMMMLMVMLLAWQWSVDEVVFIWSTSAVVHAVEETPVSSV